MAIHARRETPTRSQPVQIENRQKLFKGNSSGRGLSGQQGDGQLAAAIVDKCVGEIGQDVEVLEVAGFRDGQ